MVAVVLACTAARAGDVWDGEGANTNVTTAANWNDGVLPTLTGGSSTLFFATSGTLATLDTPVDIERPVLNAATLFSPLSLSRTSVLSAGSPFVDTAAATTAFTIGGTSSLTLRGTSGVGLVAGPWSALPNVSYRLSAPVTLANTQSWQVGTGAVSTSLVVDGQISGNGGLNLIGTGALILTRTNSYSGGTTITSGTLQLGNGGAAASVVGGIVNNATLAFGNGLGSAARVTNQISGTGTLVVQGYGPVLLANAANTFSGGIEASGQLIVTDPAALGTGTSAIVVRGYQDAIPGGGVLRIVSPTTPLSFNRAIALSGTNRTPGIGGDVLRLNNSGLMTVGDVTVSSVITSASASTLYRIGSQFGTLTLTGTISPQAGSRLGVANAIVTGRVVGSGSLAVVGGGVTLTNTTNSIGLIQMRSGRLRAASGGALSDGVTWSYGGDDATLEIRTSATDASTFAPLAVAMPVGGFNGGVGTSPFFVDRAVGGSDINVTVPLSGFFLTGVARSTPLGSRNGYGFSLGTSGSNFGGNRSFANLTSNANGLVTIAGNPTGDLLIDTTGDIRVSGTLGGGGSLLKNNGGVLILAGTGATMSGSTSINSGFIQVQDLSALPQGAVQLNGGSLLFQGGQDSGAGGTLSRRIQLAANGGLYANQSGTAPTRLLVNGTIGASGATKTFTLGGSSTLDNEVSSSITQTSTTQVTNLQKVGVGTWLLSGSNAFTGSTTIAGGVLKLQWATGRNLLADAGSLIFAADSASNSAAGTLQFLGAQDLASTETTGTLTPSAGAARIVASRSGTGSAVLTLAGLGTRSAGATVEFNPSASGTIVFGVAPTLATGTILGPWASFSGTTWATTVSSTTVSGLATFTDTPATGGSIASGSTANVRFNVDGPGGNVTLGAATTIVNTLLQSSTTAATAALGSGTTLRTGGIMIAAGQAGLTIGSAAGDGTLTTSSTAAGELVVWNHSGSPLTVNAVIANNSGTSALTKSGTGLLVLAGANTFTGNTTINEGTLRLSGGAATLGAIGVAANKTTIRQGGTLDINAAGVSNTVTIGMLDGSGVVTNSGGAGGTTSGTLVLGQSGTTTGSGFFTGILRDSTAARLALTKSGASSSVQTLTGLNTYTGATTIQSGVLAVTTLADIGQASGIGVGVDTNGDTNADSLVFNGGVLRYTGAANQPMQTPSVSIDRLFTLAGDGGIDSSGQFGSAGSQNNATLIFSNPAAVKFSGTAGLRTLTLQGNSTGDNRIDLLLADNLTTSNTLALTKAGSGQWVLGNKANAYSGTTTVSGGVLVVGVDSATNTRTLPTASNLNIGGGVLQSTGTFSRAVGTGTNEVQLTANNSGFAAGDFDLTVSLGGGQQLTWGANGFMTSGTILVLNSPTSLGVVTFANPIALGGVQRTISVADNANAATDYAVISGAISGAAGITKTGAPTLRLSGSNSYSGTTQLSAGSLVVETVGGEADTSNLGGPAARLRLAGGALEYIGSGETSLRPIDLTGSGTINSNGAGPLVLTSVTNSGSGAKTLTLGGQYNGPNKITSNLVDTGGALTITIYDGTWILSGTNSHTGGTNIQAGGRLGIGSDSAVTGVSVAGTGADYIVPCYVFADGGPRTIAGGLNGNTPNNSSYYKTLEVTGEYSLTVNGTSSFTSTSSASSGYLWNTITSGSLTLSNTVTFGSSVGNTTLQIGGPGQTVISGNIVRSDTTRANSLAYVGNGLLTLSGSNVGNGISTSISGGGVVLFANANAISGAGANVTVNADGVAAAGYAIDQAFLGRVVASSAGVVALAASGTNSNSLDFSSTAANLTAASLGAVGSDTRVYAGTLTPSGTTYRLGGGGGTLDFQGLLSSTRSLVVGGGTSGLGGTLILSNTASSYTGPTTVPYGVLQFSSIADTGTTNLSTLGAPAAASGTIGLGSGLYSATLRYTGTGHASNRTISITGSAGGIIDASGSGSLDMTSGTITTAIANNVVTLSGTSTAGNTIGMITATGTNVSVSKTGPGRWRLSGNNSYSGQLKVLDGTIVVSATVGSSGNSPFGTADSTESSDNFLPMVGNSAAGVGGTAALLLEGGYSIARGFSVAPLGGGASQVVVIGMTGSGEASFSGGCEIRLGRDVTLQAVNGGTAKFGGSWTGTSGTAGPPPTAAINIGSQDNAGTVLFDSFVPGTISALNVRHGTLRINVSGSQGGGVGTIGYAAPVNLGQPSTSGTFDLNGLSQSLRSLSFTGPGSRMTGGTLRLFNSGSAGSIATVTGSSGTGHVIASAVALDDDANFNVMSDARLLVSGGIIDGSPSGRTLMKLGSGVLELTGTSDYTGATTVSAGRLLVNGRLSNSAVTVQSGGLLGGSGTFGGSISVLSGGTLSPGNSPGIIEASSLSLAGTTLMEIDGLSPAGGIGGYDFVNVTGLLTYGGSMVIDFGSGITSAFSNGTEFNLFDFGSSSGSFSSITTASDGSWYAGLTFAQSGSKWTAEKGSQRLEFTQSTGTLVIVPEPATLALAGIGIAAAAWAIRRRLPRC